MKKLINIILKSEICQLFQGNILLQKARLL